MGDKRSKAQKAADWKAWQKSGKAPPVRHKTVNGEPVAAWDTRKPPRR